MFSHRLAARPGPLLTVTALTLAALVSAGGCGGGHSDLIVEMGGEAIRQGEFDAFAARTLSDGAPDGGDPPSSELLSRLLDRYIDEELIVREAERQGIQVTADELEDEMRFLRMPEGEVDEGGPEEGPGAAGAADDARRSVLLAKFREERLLSDVDVTDEEISAYYDEHRNRFRQSTRLVLRQILMDDEDEARKLRDELYKDPTKFVEAAERRSLAPDAGQPAAYQTANLPPEIIEAVEAVAEGQVSRVSKSPEGVRIFLVEKKEAAREVSVEEASERIRLILMQEKTRKAYEELIESLRRKAEVTILEKNLSFKYVRP